MLTGRTRTWGWVAAGPPASLPPSPRAPWTPALAPELTFPNTPASSLPGSRQMVLSKVSPRTRPHWPLARSKVGVQRSWRDRPCRVCADEGTRALTCSPDDMEEPSQGPAEPREHSRADRGGGHTRAHTRTHTCCTRARTHAHRLHTHTCAHMHMHTHAHTLRHTRPRTRAVLRVGAELRATVQRKEPHPSTNVT